MRWFTSSLCCVVAFSIVDAISLVAQPSGSAAAYQTSPSATAASTAIKNFSCTKEELEAFLPEAVVRNVLLKNNFSEADANAIALELWQKNTMMREIMKKKASKLRPNPLEDLSQRDVGLKIYRETLYEVFSQTLKAHGISDEDKIQNLLDEIRETKSKLFLECVGSKKQNP